VLHQSLRKDTLLGKTPFARHFARKWSGAELEVVKRAVFAHITRESTDQRNYDRKAVNRALRQIGKRNQVLNEGGGTDALE
jgi:hypothetical protein